VAVPHQEMKRPRALAAPRASQNNLSQVVRLP